MGSIILGIVIFIFDIMTKLVAELHLRPVGTVPIWQGVFHLTYVENRGIAFGLFEGERLLFIVVTVVVLALLSQLYTKTVNRTRWIKLGMSLVYGGALGNLIERMAKGYVVDFLDFRLIHFPVFNVADIAVCVGAICLMVHFLLTEEGEARE